MASNLDREGLSARKSINPVFTRVSGIFWSSTSFPCSERFSAPKGARKCLSPTKHGNGVKPIKQACTIALRDRYGWRLETSINYATRSPGKVDATKVIDNHLFALEWETGNISSSHRAVNKMVLGLLRGVFLGTVLVLPSRKLYPYLTDRIGNYEELEPYFDVWRAVRIEEGFLAIFVIEHDRVDNNVPTITKGTDGRALV
ncbi:restriction endonuclease [Trichocoleus sp. DQ-U1]|uniref:restriction endonuclease n=1 Tax=Trichocoleus sp. DQ-U1 TaxID=2933926 RepID=UPI003298161B